MSGSHALRVQTSSQSVEWNTPLDLLEEIRKFLGGIDLDPALPGLENGLTYPWTGKVYLNPPYGRQIGKWVHKWLTDPLEEGFLLVPGRFDTLWFRPLYQLTICWMYGRLKFSGVANSAPFPTVLVYRGPRAQEFRLAFSHRGHIDDGKWEEIYVEVTPYQLPLA